MESLRINSWREIGKIGRGRIRQYGGMNQQVPPGVGILKRG